MTLELPESVIRAIQFRVDEVNADDEDGELVDFDDVVEWLLVSEVTVKRLPCSNSAFPISRPPCSSG